MQEKVNNITKKVRVTKYTKKEKTYKKQTKGKTLPFSYGIYNISYIKYDK